MGASAKNVITKTHACDLINITVNNMHAYITLLLVKLIAAWFLGSELSTC